MTIAANGKDLPVKILQIAASLSFICESDQSYERALGQNSGKVIVAQLSAGVEWPTHSWRQLQHTHCWIFARAHEAETAGPPGILTAIGLREQKFAVFCGDFAS